MEISWYICTIIDSKRLFMNTENQVKLPENAFRELKEGEEYQPVMPSASRPREVTAWSLVLGLVLAVVFSAACAYLGL